MMKSAIPGCWQENDQLEGEEQSHGRGGEVSGFDGQVTRDCCRYWSGD